MPCCLPPGTRRKACRPYSKNVRHDLPATETTIPPYGGIVVSGMDPALPGRVLGSTTGAACCFRAEVTGRQPALVEEIAPGLLVDQVERQVAARLQIVVQTRTRLPGRGFRRGVVRDRRGAPQAASGVVAVTHDHQPAVLRPVHVPLGVQAPVVVLDVGFQYPYPPQLVAHVLGV